MKEKIKKTGKIVFKVLCILLFLWGIIISYFVFFVDKDFSVLHDKFFYLFVILPLFFIVFLFKDFGRIFKKILAVVKKKEFLDWLKQNWFKIIIALTIFFVGLSFFYYSVIFLPYKEKIRIEQQRQEQIYKEEQERKEVSYKQEQEKKEYIAKRKNECYSIYERERKQFSNVEGNEYNEKKDVCKIRYKAVKGEWKGKNCDDYLPKAETSNFFRELLLEQYFNCTSNTFTKEF